MTDQKQTETKPLQEVTVSPEVKQQVLDLMIREWVCYRWHRKLRSSVYRPL